MNKTFTISATQAGTFNLADKTPIYRMGFGAMRITGPGIWGDPKDPKEARAVLKRAVELGVNFIDTADSYGPEVSENLIAEALYPYPSNLIIGTKGGLTRQGPDKWTPVGRPEYLNQCVEMSLRRLRLNCIQLYQFHYPDPLVPIEDSLDALRKMQKEGKIRYIGLSNVSLSDIKKAKKVCDIVSIQNRYNIKDRASDDVLDFCEKNKLAFIPWSPLEKGGLSQGRGEIEKLAKAKGVTPTQIVLAWLLKRSPVMVPIPGTASLKHLEENIGAASLTLTQSEFERLEI